LGLRPSQDDREETDTATRNGCNQKNHHGPGVAQPPSHLAGNARSGARASSSDCLNPPQGQFNDARRSSRSRSLGPAQKQRVPQHSTPASRPSITTEARAGPTLQPRATSKQSGCKIRCLRVNAEERQLYALIP